MRAKWVNGVCSNCNTNIPTDNIYDCISESENKYCYNCGEYMLESEEEKFKERLRLKEVDEAVDKAMDRILKHIDEMMLF